jgi:hypothetical protein
MASRSTIATCCNSRNARHRVAMVQSPARLVIALRQSCLGRLLLGRLLACIRSSSACPTAEGLTCCGLARLVGFARRGAGGPSAG